MTPTSGAAALFRLDPDESIHVVLTGVTVSNGLAWSPDGSTVYYVDSPTQRIDAFDFDAATAAFENQRTVVEVDAQLGSPDGLTVDAEGGLWLALWDGAAVHRYAPDGRLGGVIELPTSRVTACTFGGPALDQLFITTSALGLDGREEMAAAVFRAEPGVAGLPAGYYRG
jgi:sugar lactone lactonase YvrE